MAWIVGTSPWLGYPEAGMLGLAPVTPWPTFAPNIGTASIFIGYIVAANYWTSIENPLPVDEHTLFQFGSTGKTFTATAMMRLVEQGLVDLDAPEADPQRRRFPHTTLRIEQLDPQAIQGRDLG